MGMDFNFWKYKEGVAHDNDRVYESACCDGKIVEGLESLPIDDIFKKVASVFSDWTALDKNHYEKEGRGAFEIFTTSQIVRFDCYGMQEADRNALMDILIDYGCPLYDPQIATRFDSWTDR
ncbi:MAG: hypothetical protein HDR21_14385 [Lachnospiraceae bacterium]|nr:hypothetical protein [Lachnospiraceae bacterium]